MWVSQPSLSEPCLFALSILIRTTHSVHVSNREWAWLWCFYRLWFYVFVNGEKVCWVNAMSNRPIIWSINDWLGFNKTAPHLSVMRVYCPLWTLNRWEKWSPEMLKDMTKVTASECKATERTSTLPTDVFPAHIVVSSPEPENKNKNLHLFPFLTPPRFPPAWGKFFLFFFYSVTESSTWGLHHAWTFRTFPI